MQILQFDNIYSSVLKLVPLCNDSYVCYGRLLDEFYYVVVNSTLEAQVFSHNHNHFRHC